MGGDLGDGMLANRKLSAMQKGIILWDDITQSNAKCAVKNLVYGKVEVLFSRLLFVRFVDIVLM